MNCYYCIFYVGGLFLVFAYDNISYNKGATESNTYWGQATNAVDGNISTCTMTYDIGYSSRYTTVWWKVDLGGVYSIYSISILFKSYEGFVKRQEGRFAGFSLYVSDTDVSSDVDIKGSTLCYKDGPQLPPLNFTGLCTEKGRYVIFYNERLKDVAYPTGYESNNIFTELCEVIIQGCNNTSVYGSKCDTPCSTNCKDNLCHIQNGTCFNCNPGWIGSYCKTRCGEGMYGENCSNQCAGHCRDRYSCNHVTGQCYRGCEAGWTGDLCNKECDDGTYGYNCVNNCSGHCLNGSPCNKQTGHCDGGCNPGYTNENCSKECPSGYFGMNCIEKCSEHCINKATCDHVSGMCPSGCQDGFVGTHCNKSCNGEYFGRNCSQKCSNNCKPDTCRQTDGLCTCSSGWTGDNCSTACVKSYGEYCRNPCSLHCYNNTCDKINGRCLIGCKDGFYSELCDKENLMKNQHMSSVIMLVIGLSVSVLINLILIVCGILLCRGIAINQVTFTGSLLKCWKDSVYQDTVVKCDETSTYQELDISENAYQNTAIR